MDRHLVGWIDSHGMGEVLRRLGSMVCRGGWLPDLVEMKRDINVGRDSSSDVVVSLGKYIYYLGYTTRWLVICSVQSVMRRWRSLVDRGMELGAWPAL